jgi:transcriptional regulator with XRE-family HTH domain
MVFGDRFRAVLRAYGLTQFKAAELLEMDQSTVSYYCNLDRPPRPHTLQYISERLGISEAELRGEKLPSATKKSVAAKSAMFPPPDQSVCRALHQLKRRWKKKAHERDTIRHLVAALFPSDHEKVLSWLEQG